MRKNIFFLAFILNIVLLSSCAALGSETRSTYVVLMDRQKMKSLEASLEPSKKWQEQIIESIIISDRNDDDSLPAQLHHAYDAIVSGFSAELSELQLESLKDVDGFLYAIRDELRNLHTTHSPQFLGLQPGQGLWSTENLASDVIIGVVDTGIWPEHHSFGDLGLPPVPSRWKGRCDIGPNFNSSNCNRKLIGAAAFFKGYESIAGRINEMLDYRSARDSDGHGTHTASTAGAYMVDLGFHCLWESFEKFREILQINNYKTIWNFLSQINDNWAKLSAGGDRVGRANILGRAEGTAAGMRYTARIAAYKACHETGCAASDILAAMDRAVKDGVDVLSLSLGGKGVPYYTDSVAIGAFGAIRKGVIVSMSAGNSGPHSSTVVNVAPWLMTVAASTTDRSFVARIHLGDGNVISGASLSSGKLPLNHLVYNETGEAKFCMNGSLSPSQVKGNIVFCVRGGTARVAKGQVVKDAGGVGMILANDVDQGEDIMTDPHVLPAVSLGVSAASAIINYTKSSKNPMAWIEFRGEMYDNPAPVMAAFSSRGPNPIDYTILKPDVTAPGVDILAAWPPNISPTGLKDDKRRVLFNFESGTSMSCPHVSGLIALLKSRHTDWSPAAIKSALMTTAYVHNTKKSPISDGASFNNSESATPFAFGSGHVNPNEASQPGLIYDISTQDYLDYLCSLNYNPRQMAVFAGTCPATSRFRSVDLNYPSFSVGFRGKFSGTKCQRTVTNVGTAMSNYTVNVIEPEGVSITVHPAVLNFKKTGEKRSYNVTFKAKQGNTPPTKSVAFGSLEWVSECKYSVRSPIAVKWNI